MTTNEFKKTVDHIRTSNYPRRALFISTISPIDIRTLVSPLDVHETELCPAASSDLSMPEQLLQKRLAEICEDFESKKKEPAVLIITDAVLLARFSVSLTPIFRTAISPRSMVILCLPKPQQTILPPNLQNVIAQDFLLPIQRLAGQISESDCIIQE